MLKHLEAIPQIYPVRLGRVALDANALIRIAQMDDPATFVDRIVAHYDLVIPPTALSEFDPQGDDKIERFGYSVGSFEGAPLAAREMLSANSKLRNFTQIYYGHLHKSNKLKELRGVRNNFRNDFHILHQCFQYRAALVSDDSDFKKLGNFLHAPGTIIENADACPNVSARVPVFTLEELERSFSEDITWDSYDMETYDYEDLELEPPNEVITVEVPTPIEIEARKIPLRTPNEDWNFRKQIISNPQISIMLSKGDKQSFGVVVQLRRSPAS
jgi:hypothetical protein